MLRVRDFESWLDLNEDGSVIQPGLTQTDQAENPQNLLFGKGKVLKRKKLEDIEKGKDKQTP